MTGLSWQAVDDGEINESCCEMKIRDDLPVSRLVVWDAVGSWSWQVMLYASKDEHFACGDGCATEGKARFMAMSLVSALLQIIDGVRPHEVD